ncbi:MAG: tripartite tricarboxylate transporter substrate-binding protein [Sulfuricaulis sp.]|uniref:Bug family tripartite tricarboxylate transporter substrate binding protein n=1 Tax=Sulfuricaulis sp. TaxID=2003553 RepID=UPI0034A2AE73
MMRKPALISCLKAISLAVLWLAWPVTADAQSYPTKPVRFIIGLTPGSSSDITVRIIGQKLTELWGQSAVIDNRPGAGGNIGAELVASASPDGYTLLFWNVGLAIGHSYYRKLPFNALTDFVPVSLATSMPQVACVTPSLPVTSIQELIALAKSRPGDVLFSSAGNGQADHMAGELFAYLAKVKLTHIPYRFVSAIRG